MGKKRINPRRRVTTQADVERARRQAVDNAVYYAWAVMLTALRDKFGFGKTRLQRLWGEVEDLGDSIAKGYINVQDLIDVLKEEADIELTK